MEQGFLFGIVNNISMLLLLCFFFNLSARYWRGDSIAGKVLTGAFFGLVAVVGMIFPVQYANGVIFDGRTIVLGMLGLFGGPLPTAVAATVCAFYRLLQGGDGVIMGLGTIVSAAMIGIVARYWQRRCSLLLRPLGLYGVGLVIHGIMLAWTLTLPAPLRGPTFQNIALPVMTVYPLATMLFGLVMRELQERRRAVRTLQKSETLFRSLFENMAVGAALVDAEGYYQRVNPAFSLMLGYTADELQRMRFTDITCAEDRDLGWRRFRELVSGNGDSYTAEKRFCRRDGSVIWGSVTVSVARDPDGGIQNIIGIFVETTKEKMAEDALRASEVSLRASQERYQAIMHQSSEAIAIVDIVTKKFLEVNTRWSQLLGYNAAEALELRYYDTFVESNQVMDRIHTELLVRREIPAAVRRLRDKNNRLLEVEWSAAVIQYAEKQVFLFVSRDISAERRYQEHVSREVALAADVLQNLLPAKFSDVVVTVDTVYEPYHLVSGDFYDFSWSQDNRKFAGYVLDISGHGVGSSLQGIAVSAYFRSVMGSPMRLAAKLHWLNQNVMRYFTDETYAAAICFEFDFLRQTLTVVSAGIYGFLASTGDFPVVVKRAGSLIGITANPEYEEWTVPIRQGDTFYFMSDGIFDQLNAGRQTERLGNFFETVSRLRSLARSPERTDDCCAVCVHIGGSTLFPIRFQLQQPDEYRRIRDQIRALLDGIAPAEAGKIDVALGEALNNGARESLSVQVKVSLFKDRLIIRVKDGGAGFNGNERVASLSRLGAAAAFEERLLAENGRGILIMTAWLDRVIYNQAGNEVMLVKRLPRATSALPAEWSQLCGSGGE